jgi:hypothetical protein
VRLLNLMETCNETCNETCKTCNNGHLAHPLQVTIAGGIAGPNMVRCRNPVPAANRKGSLYLYRGVSVRRLKGQYKFTLDQHEHSHL